MRRLISDGETAISTQTLKKKTSSTRWNTVPSSWLRGILENNAIRFFLPSISPLWRPLAKQNILSSGRKTRPRTLRAIRRETRYANAL